jgi:hypothetical protein
VRVTLGRANSTKGPIIGKPESIVHEANDIRERAGMTFRARRDKHFRRKLLSSKLEDDSSIVVFENSEMIDGRIRGGSHWNACIQMGVGSRFHRVYLDDISVPKLISYLKAPLDSADIRDFISLLITESDKGIPRLSEEWIEFPGYVNEFDEYRNMIDKKRLKVPCASAFQEAFTTDIEDLGNIVGPLDFFDGLDAIMMLALMHTGNRDLKRRSIHVGKVRDANRYPQRCDPRIVSLIENARIPLVTIASAMLSVHVLRKMYDDDPQNRDSQIALSLGIADKALSTWISS